MKTIDRISLFCPKLNDLYKRMILGINVEITPEFRKEWGKENLGQWFFIQSMNDDETFQICSTNHQIFMNVPKNGIITR